MEERTNAAAIKVFSQVNGGRKVTMEEFKRLSNDEREELGELAANAMSIADTNEDGAAGSDERPPRNES